MGVSPKVLKQAIPLPGDLALILSSSHKLRHAYVVGGAVRDALLGTQPKDFDIEVYGLSESALLRELKKHGQANLVGRSFGVIKLKTQAGKEYDFSLPRTERKIAQGHGGFDVRTDPNMDREQASARRDFTVNALFYDSREEHVMDYHGGLTDLNQQRLHPTSDAFIEDPLRVLRAMQFLSRFSFQSSEALVQRARSIVPTFSELSTERVRAEWLKWASQSRSPSRGLHFLRDSSWIQHFPELLPLSETPQDPIWHPEGNVFEHTCYVCDALASLDEWRSATEINRRILMFAALGHDLGKATTTQEVLRAGRRRGRPPDRA